MTEATLLIWMSQSSFETSSKTEDTSANDPGNLGSWAWYGLVLISWETSKKALRFDYEINQTYSMYNFYVKTYFVKWVLKLARTADRRLVVHEDFAEVQQ